MADVFLSYSHEDSDFVVAFSSHLAEQGYSVWFDHSISGGSQWADSIEENIDTCSLFIVIVSNNSKKSQWVHREILHAEKRNKKILPILLSGDIWFQLLHIQHVDMQHGIEQGLSSKLLRLLRESLPHFTSHSGTIEFTIEKGDIKQFGADVVYFKHARSFYGADRAVSETLEAAGVSLNDLSPEIGHCSLVDTLGSIAAQYALFLGVKKLSAMNLSDIRTFSSTALRFMAIEDTSLDKPISSIATTLHGPGFGLDVCEALVSQTKGIVDGIALRQLPFGLKKITIIELSSEKIIGMQTCLDTYFEELEYATKVDGIAWMYELAVPNKIING